MLDVRKPSEVTDDDVIISIVEVSHYGGCHSLDFWDDGYGELYGFYESLGIQGVVRARTWETAYECAVDELMHDAECICPLKWKGHGEPEPDDKRPDDDCPFHGKHTTDEDLSLPEGYQYRSSGIPSNPRLKTDIAQEDLNGSGLDPLPDKTRDERYEYFVIVERDEVEV